MENYKKYCSAFTTTFSIAGAKMENLEYNKIEEWDSMEHLNLVMAVGEEFGVVLDFNEVMAIGTVGDILKILEKKEL